MIFRSLAQRYGWTTQQIAALSLSQILMYLDSTNDSGGSSQYPMPYSEWKARQARRKR